MPNVTIFIPSAQMPSETTRAQLTDLCSNLCTDPLRAAEQNVHIIFVGTQHGRGHPVFVDVKYRTEPFRTEAIMQHFMQALDEAVTKQTGLTARIRCFGYCASAIHARN